MSNQPTHKTIRVLVVDDSNLMANQIVRILEQDPSMQVVGRACDGVEALEMLERVRPDVITLDVEMPRMNGLTALKHIMVKSSIPTVMISALTKEGSRTAFDAFRYGAVDVIAKPSRRHDESLEGQAADIISKVKRAADIRMGKSQYVRLAVNGPSAKAAGQGPADSSTRFIGIGAGTGGYYSLLRIVPCLPPEFCNVIVAVLGSSPRYVEPFVSYLDSHSAIPVMGVQGLQMPQKGACYVCSALDGLAVRRDPRVGARLAPGEDLTDSDPERATDRLLTSLAVVAGPRAVGVVMSGPGFDGALGIAEIRKAGGIGIVQDITNCMDPSMPLAVLERGSVEKIIPDFKMAEFFMELQ